MLQSDRFFEIVRIVFDITVHRSSYYVKWLLYFANISNQCFMQLQHNCHCEINSCAGTVRCSTKLQLSMLGKKRPVPMNGQKLHFMIIPHPFYFALIACLYVSQYFQVTETSTGLKDSTKYHISLVEGKINDKRMNRLSFEL